MTHRPTLHHVLFLSGAMALLLLLGASVPLATQPTDRGVRSAPGFLQAGRCYRFTFSVAGAPNWKVLELLDAGWIRAEVDAGPAAAQREPAWINTAQLITVRDVRCSD